MKTKSLISVVLFLSFYASSIFSQNLNSDNLSLSLKKNNIMVDLRVNPNADKQLHKSYIRNVLDIKRVKKNLIAEKPKEKSTLLGIGLSALLPGAGQFYAKQTLKAAIFFGVEVLAWTSFAYFRFKGDDKVDEYQEFADNNWDIRRYGRWLRDNFPGCSGINPDETNLEVLRFYINQCESQHFTHTLPELHSQQYYELIGKYQNFLGGWADAVNITQNNYQTAKTPMFIFYSEERQKANDFYNYAATGIYVVILNHILSAADAAWSVSIYNKKLKMETGFRINKYHSPFTNQYANLPSLNLKVSF
ncbi:MAG: hypothetical protein ACRDFC_03645 [Ignavibacteria bacterium]